MIFDKCKTLLSLTVWVVGVAAIYCMGEGPHYAANVVITADSRPTIQLTNLSESPLTAFIITTEISDPKLGHRVELYFDNVVNYGHDRSLMPRKSAMIPLPFVVGSDPTMNSSKVRAVIFEDGTTFGELFWVRRLLARRNALLHNLQQVRTFLLDHSRMLHSRSEIISDLKQFMRVSSTDSVDPYLDFVRKMVPVMASENLIQPPDYEENGEFAAQFAALTSNLEHWQKLVRDSKPTSFTETRDFSEETTVTTSAYVCAPPILSDTKILDLGCGSSVHNLKAQMGQRTIDYGDHTVYGACWGARIDCDGVSRPSGTNEGFIIKPNPFEWQPLSDGSWRLLWQFRNFTLNPTVGCYCTDPNPNGTKAATTTAWPMYIIDIIPCGT
jgi:hypothetical protein